jgi:hypothetical protein
MLRSSEGGLEASAPRFPVESSVLFFFFEKPPFFSTPPAAKGTEPKLEAEQRNTEHDGADLDVHRRGRNKL